MTYLIRIFVSTVMCSGYLDMHLKIFHVSDYSAHSCENCRISDTVVSEIKYSGEVTDAGGRQQVHKVMPGGRRPAPRSADARRV